MLAVNLDGLLHCCQAALPDLLAAEAGRIVTIASMAGLHGFAYAAPYIAAKHGAVGLTRALAAEYAATGLTRQRGLPRLRRHRDDGGTRSPTSAPRPAAARRRRAPSWRGSTRRAG